MKRENKLLIKTLVYYLLISIVSLPAIAQQTPPANTIYYQSEKQTQASPCVTKEEMNQIKNRIEQSKKRLEAEGKLSANRVLAFGPHSFRWPLAPAANNYNLGYYYIQNYVDLNQVSSGLQGHEPGHTLEDYNCGARTYDVFSSGYDHDGIDITTAPFGWSMMDNADVDVVAVEGGFISDKVDGEFDRTCRTPSPNVYHGNYVAITHSDGSSTLYMHMKSGTVTDKDTGEYVSVGEYLGKVGSSGNSSDPHLHFEVQDNLGDIRDPFQNGSCNSGDNLSLWANEEPYYNRKIISIFTLSAPWTDKTCDTTGASYGTSEIVPYKNHFSSGDPIFFSAGVRDYTALLPIQLKMIDPSGNVLSTNTFSYPNAHIAFKNTSALLFFAPATTGTYSIQCSYNGVTRAHYFTVGCPGSISLASTRTSNYGKISGGYIASTDSITASARNVQYQAEDYIQLNEGFIATNGCEFLARIDNCSVGGTKEGDDVSVNDRNKFEVKIFPNPFSANSMLELTVSSDEFISIAIYDATGRIVKSIAENLSIPNGTHKFSIDGSQLQSGIYQLVITNLHGKKIVQKLSRIN